MEFLKYILNNYDLILKLTLEHIYLTAIAVVLAIVIGVPLGILISSNKLLNKPILSSANLIQAIPSMALLGFMIPFLGIGIIPAIIAVFMYSLLPIIKNTYTGISNINPQTIEAAKGIGLTKFQILYKIEIPLALPVIMTGVRVASVTAVGLMTMAAFIGAGGLGSLVFLGIRTVNNNQILAGAIPACILALFVDYALALLEKIVTPINIQKGNNASLKKTMKIKKIALLFIIIILGSLMFLRPKQNSINDNTITIGSKDFTEQVILSSLASQLIENNTDIKVNRKFNLGGTKVCFSAMKTKDIDMYFEYTGTLYTDILKNKPISDARKVYKEVSEKIKKIYDINVLDKSKFNNTYILAVRKDTKEKYNLKNINDLAKNIDKFKFGVTFEFSGREDGLIGLQKAYDFSNPKVITIDGSPRYVALDNKKVNVVDAFATDGLLKKFDLVKLEDNLSFFPPYNAAALVNEKTLKKHPEIKDLLNKLISYLDDEEMINLNYQVDELGKNPDDVAFEFLQKNNLIK